MPTDIKKILLKNIKNIYASIAIILCLGSGYYFYDFIWSEFEKEKEQLINDQKKAQDELNKINAQKPRIPMLEADLAKADIAFERLKEIFPDEEKVPRRLQDLHAVVRASGVNIQTFKPTGKAEKEHYVENNYSFSVNAGYHMLGYLFAEIANFNYPTTIDNLKLGPSGAITQEIKKSEDHGWEPITMNVSFDLTTFTRSKQQ